MILNVDQSTFFERPINDVFLPLLNVFLRLLKDTSQSRCPLDKIRCIFKRNANFIKNEVFTFISVKLNVLRNKEKDKTAYNLLFTSIPVKNESDVKC